MQDLTHHERAALAEALYTKAMLTLDSRSTESAEYVGTLTGIARKAGIEVEPDADRFLGFVFVVPPEQRTTATHAVIECGRCESALRAAEGLARSTGSRASTYTYEGPGDEIHSATWVRP